MTLRILAATAAVAVSALLSGCATYDDSNGPSYMAYDYDHPDPAYGGYDAARYYRDAPTYNDRVMTSDERLYRGNDGRYYCRRSDGTTGLIVGGLAGGILGDIIAPGGSKTLGTIIGAGGGAVIGQAIDKDGAHCR